MGRKDNKGACSREKWRNMSCFLMGLVTAPRRHIVVYGPIGEGGTLTLKRKNKRMQLRGVVGKKRRKRKRCWREADFHFFFWRGCSTPRISFPSINIKLTQVIDQLLEIVLKYPPMKGQDSECDSTFMDIDEPTMKVKGKLKVEENGILEPESERSTGLVKVTFVLKLLSDILLMYGHAVGVILRRDSEMCQFRGSNQPSGHNGIVHHVLHRLLPLSVDKSAGPDDWRGKLSEKASWFLVVLCGRSGEGRKRVTNELVKELMSFFKSGEQFNEKQLIAR